MQYRSIPPWKKTPFIRLLLPFAAGILLQWYQPFSVTPVCYIAGASLLLIAVLSFVNINIRFRFRWVHGICLNVLLACTGIMVCYYHHPQNHQHWVGHHYQAGNPLLITLLEPATAKEKTYKTTATIEAVQVAGQWKPVTGTMLVYFSKEGHASPPPIGTRLVFSKPLQTIKGTGNPGAFDYSRYCAFQGIYHQAFIKAGEYITIPVQQKMWLARFLVSAREKVLHALTTYIPGKKESGLAEALLIGYKDDLDPELVQSYSDTGVVHIIAISGMHLALIYWLLTLLLRPLNKWKAGKIIKPILAIVLLWMFSLMTGGSASVVRSAAMFTCIIIGESFSRKHAIYNTMAASAFILLCYNPYWLWDVGFQLSYGAVLSILLFMKPIYRSIYIRNKLLDYVWQLFAVSIAAQIITAPISIYHFHQFPVCFLITNLVAVPLSTIIMIGTILLCVLAWLTPVAMAIGKLCSGLIYLMNSSIERVGMLPFATWEGLSISVLQTLLLYFIIIVIILLLQQYQRKWIYVILATGLCFSLLRLFSFVNAEEQQKLIVYQIPKQQAIEIIKGRQSTFIADPGVIQDLKMQSFHLHPSRVMHRVNKVNTAVIERGFYETVRKKKLVILKDPDYFEPPEHRISVHLLILSHHHLPDIDNLLAVFDAGIIVFDASNPQWKVEKWVKTCEMQHQPCYAVTQNGAFVTSL